MDIRQLQFAGAIQYLPPAAMNKHFHVLAGTASSRLCCVESAEPGSKSGPLKRMKKVCALLSLTDLFYFYSKTR